MLTVFAWCSLGLAFLCAITIAVDLVRRPQKMAVMDVVWPITALYFSVFAVWAYFSFGRAGVRGTAKADDHGSPMGDSLNGGDGDPAGGGKHPAPTPAQVAEGTSHCGAGCTLADVGTEFLIAASGLVIFSSPLVTGYVFDFVVAWLLGIAFQYMAIKPMRADLSPTQTILAAMKADTLSILAFQVGMYLFMALVYFRLFPAPHHLNAFDPRYWLMMQVAMICGFATSFPMNRVLIAWGWKEAM